MCRLKMPLGRDQNRVSHFSDFTLMRAQAFVFSLFSALISCMICLVSDISRQMMSRLDAKGAACIPPLDSCGAHDFPKDTRFFCTVATGSDNDLKYL